LLRGFSIEEVLAMIEAFSFKPIWRFLTKIIVDYGWKAMEIYGIKYVK